MDSCHRRGGGESKGRMLPVLRRIFAARVTRETQTERLHNLSQKVAN